MSESERFHRYGGIPKGKRSDPEIPAVDDGDPVLRPKPCSKSRCSDPTFLVLGFVAFIVVGYMSVFYTTHELGQSYTQYREEEAKHVETVVDLHALSFGEGDYDQDVVEGLGSSGPHERVNDGVPTSNKALGSFESREGRAQTPDQHGFLDGKEAEVLLTGARDSRGIGGVLKKSLSGDELEGKTVHAAGESLYYPGSRNQPGLSETVETLEKGDEATGSTSELKKPNIFFFLIDDMGFGDIGYQSTDLKELTPNLDRLAKEGIKLSNYYSMSLCTPARASLMTGRYPVRLGLQYSVLVPGEPWGLPLYEKILPQYMNDAGYESHMVGKWHLGSYNYESLPTHRGFETYLGYLNGEDNYWTHKNLEAYLDGKQFYDFGFGNQTDYYDITRLDNEGMPCSAPKMTGGSVETGHDYAGAFLHLPTSVCHTGGYPTDTFLGRAHQVVESKTPWDDEPLFMYIAHQSVHSPLGPAPMEGFNKEELDKLEAVWETTTSSNRADFAGVLAYLDKRIGIFVDMLEKKGWLENSIIVVASDNGGCPSDGGCNYPLRGSKQSMFEGGTKVPAFIYSKSHLPKESWGKSYDELMHVSDWVPTLTSAVGSQPTGSAGALDGVDHWGSLVSMQSKDSSPYYSVRKELLYNWDAYLLSSTNGLKSNYALAQGAFRDGDWKLLTNVWCSGYYSHDPIIIESDPLLNIDATCVGTEGCEDCADNCQYNDDCLFGDRLFNLRNDSREENDLIHQYPEIAERLRARVIEVVFKEYTPSGYKDVNTDSYQVWADNGWWMVPWVDKLHPQTA